MGRIIIAAITALLIITGCNNNKVYYYTYEHTPIEGWEKNDDVEFEVPPLPSTGTYAVSLGMRLSDEYPFQNLNMVVKQTIYRNGIAINNNINDTITIKAANRQGAMNGNGVTLYQYDMLLRKTFYQQGDSIHFTVRHNMKREILPGIADVGLILKRY